MTEKNHIEAIIARRKAIDAQIAALEQEDHELETALNVLQRLSSERGSKSKGGGAGTPRPEGIPTIFEMVERVLKDAEHDGDNGLTARQIVDAIDRRYWPGVADSQIQPSLYRFAKAKRLRKRGTKFHRVQKDEAPPDKSDGAPEVTGEGATSPIESRGGMFSRHG